MLASYGGLNESQEHAALSCAIPERDNQCPVYRKKVCLVSLLRLIPNFQSLGRNLMNPNIPGILISPLDLRHCPSLATPT